MQSGLCFRQLNKAKIATDTNTLLIYLFLYFAKFVFLVCISGHQSGFCMICVMQNHIIQAFANTGNAIKPVSFIRDLKSKYSRM